MQTSYEMMIRRESRQTAIGHTIVLVGLFAAAAFAAPRYLVLVDDVLGLRSTAAELAVWLVQFMGYHPLLCTGALLAFGYLDYRLCLLLRARQLSTLASVWSTAIAGGAAAGVLWFSWALSIPHIQVWKLLNPKSDVPHWASGTGKACILFIASFVSLMVLDVLLGRRERNRDG